MKLILIVDNKKIERETLMKLASGPDRKVESAGNVDDALSLIQNNQFDVVITDLKLSGRDNIAEEGLDVLRAARAKSHKTQVIVVTDYPSDPSVVTAIAEGAFNYLDRTTVAPNYQRVLPRQIELALCYEERSA